MNETDHPRISRSPNVMSGKAVIAGTRVPVETVLRHLGNGVPLEELLNGYPTIKREDVLAAQAYAADVLADDEALVAAE